jgi:hypothetical protein
MTPIRAGELRHTFEKLSTRATNFTFEKLSTRATTLLKTSSQSEV